MAMKETAKGIHTRRESTLSSLRKRVWSSNRVIRNGDAHLKNFGLIYPSLSGPVRLAPAYDLVTTPVYIPQDSMALTLGGSTRWPGRDKLKRLGQSLCELTLSQINHIIDEVLDAVAETQSCLLYTSPSPRDATLSRMPSSA